MKCRVFKCPAKAISDLCGKHEEDREDGVELQLIPPPGSRAATPFPRPARGPRCSARTSKGTGYCLRGARAGSDLCGFHLWAAGRR